MGGRDGTTLVAIGLAVAIAVGIVAGYFVVVYSVESVTTHRGVSPWQAMRDDLHGLASHWSDTP